MNRNEIINKLQPLLKAKTKLKLVLERHHPELLDAIYKETSFLPNNCTFAERMYCLNHNLYDTPLCKFCKTNHVKYVVWKGEYATYCSKKCCYSDPNRCDDYIKNRTEDDITNMVQKMKKTKLERYGDENYCNTKKAQETKLERYGDEKYCNVEKQIQTRDEKYHGDYSSVVQKVKKTKLERYGNANYCNIEKVKQTLSGYTKERWAEIINKRTQTMLERYGVKNSSQMESVKRLHKQRSISKYGIDNPLNIPSVKEKAKATIRKKSWLCIISDKDSIPMFTENEYIYKYKSSDELPFKCSKCGLEYTSKQYAWTHKKCPKCFNHSSSVGERSVYDFITSIYHGNIITRDRTLIYPYEIDIIIPDLNLAIEYNGLFYHNSIAKNITYHQTKTSMCENKNYMLFHIFEDEWIYKQDIVKLYIKNLLRLDVYEIDNNISIHEVDLDCAYNFTVLNTLNKFKEADYYFSITNNECEIGTASIRRIDDNNILSVYVSPKYNIQYISTLVFKMFKEKYQNLLMIIDRRLDNIKNYIDSRFHVSYEIEPTIWGLNYNMRLRIPIEDFDYSEQNIDTETINELDKFRKMESVARIGNSGYYVIES